MTKEKERNEEKERKERFKSTELSLDTIDSRLVFLISTNLRLLLMEVQDKSNSTTIMLPDSLTMLVIEDLVLSKLFEEIIFEELNVSICVVYEIPRVYE